MTTQALINDGVFTMMRGHNIFANPPLIITADQVHPTHITLICCVTTLLFIHSVSLFHEMTSSLFFVYLSGYVFVMFWCFSCLLSFHQHNSTPFMSSMIVSLLDPRRLCCVWQTHAHLWRCSHGVTPHTHIPTSSLHILVLSAHVAPGFFRLVLALEFLSIISPCVPVIQHNMKKIRQNNHNQSHEYIACKSTIHNNKEHKRWTRHYI